MLSRGDVMARLGGDDGSAGWTGNRWLSVGAGGDGAGSGGAELEASAMRWCNVVGWRVRSIGARRLGYLEQGLDSGGLVLTGAA